MTGLLALLSVILIAIIAVQIGKVSELAAKIRGEQEMQDATNRRQGNYMMIFMILFLVFVIGISVYYQNYMLGFGPHKSASEHGSSLDSLFKVTTFFTGIVFFITQILTFYFAWRYRGRHGAKAKFMPHDNKLEIVWTVIPAVVMTFLVVGGLDAWNEVMADIKPDEEVLEIEATGFQFGWNLRYPGPDGLIGEKNFRMIDASNPLGQNWKDEKNVDDFLATELVLPVGQKVRVRITAQDVLHNFYLPQFRVKMDAVPGMPTYFVFTPTKTTEEYRMELRKYPEYNVPDPNDPEKMLWETFDYELACAELCGKGHYSMRRLVRVVSPEEYADWAATQPSYYLSNVRFTDADPNKDKLFDSEINARKAEFQQGLDQALSATDAAAKRVALKYVSFTTGGAELTPLSKYELDNLAEAMSKNAAMRVELAGHTDSEGDDAMNLALSEERATAVQAYLVSKGVDASRLVARGYGETQPTDTNDTEAGRANNRRTEFRILAQ
ncbi:MAG: OmpA family protein [Lewinellaceae bacterium]|nr:OmpA family protein [Lewinellaceae bacterium]